MVRSVLGAGIHCSQSPYERICNPRSAKPLGPAWSRLILSAAGGIRVPCIIRYPPLTRHTLSKPGTVIDQPLTVMDIMPTLLDLAGVAHPVRMGQPSGKFRDREVVGMKGKSWRGMFEKGERCHDETEELGWEVRRDNLSFV